MKSKTHLVPIIALAIAGIIFFTGIGAVAVNADSGLSTKSVQQLLDLGEQYLDEGNYEQALLCFWSAMEVEPNNSRGQAGAAQAYRGLAAVATQEGRLEDATEYYLLAYDIDDDGSQAAETMIALGDEAANAGRHEDAIEYYEKAEELTPDDSGAEKSLLDAYLAEAKKKLEEDDVDGAWDAYERAKEINPNHPSLNDITDSILTLYEEYAERLISDRYFEEAYRMYEKILDFDDSNESAFIGLVIAYLGMPGEEDVVRQEEALKKLREAYDKTQSEEIMNLIQTWENAGSESPIYISSTRVVSYGKGSYRATTTTAYSIVYFIDDAPLYSGEGKENEQVGTVPRGAAAWIQGTEIGGTSFIQLTNSDYVGWVERQYLMLY